jgi:hypothetical protein
VSSPTFWGRWPSFIVTSMQERWRLLLGRMTAESTLGRGKPSGGVTQGSDVSYWLSRRDTQPVEATQITAVTTAEVPATCRSLRRTV